MFCLLYGYEGSRRTIGVILSVVLDPIVPQVAIQRHSATDESESISLFAGTGTKAYEESPKTDSVSPSSSYLESYRASIMMTVQQGGLISR